MGVVSYFRYSEEKLVDPDTELFELKKENSELQQLKTVRGICILLLGFLLGLLFAAYVN